jgi:stage III sporulation protein AG
LQTDKNNALFWALVKGKDRSFLQMPTAYRKIIHACLLVGCLGVVLMLLGGVRGRKPAAPGPEVPAKAAVLLEKAEEQWSKARLEQETAAVLAQIKGAGQVVVALQLAGSEEVQWLFREEHEERLLPQEGGESRETRVLREPVFQRKSGGEETPVRISAKAPAIAGVLVVAEGGADPKIQQALGEATATLLGIPLHRVKVLPWGK